MARRGPATSTTHRPTSRRRNRSWVTRRRSVSRKASDTRSTGAAPAASRRLPADSHANSRYISLGVDPAGALRRNGGAGRGAERGGTDGRRAGDRRRDLFRVLLGPRLERHRRFTERGGRRSTGLHHLLSYVQRTETGGC